VADDELQILRNEYVTDYHSISAAFGTDVWGFVGTGTSNFYRPLQIVIYGLEYRAYGNRPWIWHLVNLLLNAGVIALTYFMVLALADGAWAFWTALLFALHPMHAEAVVWVASLPDLLCGLLLVAAMLTYHRGRSSRGATAAWYFALSVLSFFAAEFTKETSLLFPAILLSYEFFYRQVPLLKLWKRLPELLPYVAALVIYITVRLSVLGAFTPNSGKYLQLGARDLAFEGPVLIARYLGKMLLPLHFNYFYDTPPVTSLNGLSAGAMLLAIGFIAAMFVLRRSQPLLAFGMAWFLILIAPALDVNAIGENYFTERYLYIPSLGLAILAGWAWLEFLRWSEERERQWVAWSVLVLVLGFYLFQIERRIPVFHDDLRLYQTTVLASPDSPHVQASLASAYHEAGNIPASIEHGYVAIALRPNYLWAQTNLGNSLVEVGRYEEGIQQLEAAVAEKPDSAVALVSLAKAYVDVQRWQDAEKCYRRAAQLDPSEAGYYEHLADMAASGAQGQEEIARLRDAVAQHPESLDDWNQLGRAYAKLSQWSDAIACFQEILKHKPGDVPTLLELSVAAQAGGDFATAVTAGQQAAAAEPNDIGLQLNLSSAYFAAGRYDNVIVLLTGLLRRAPALPHPDRVHFTLGLAYEKKSQWAAAAEQYREALQLNPQLTAAQNQLNALQSRLAQH